MPKKDCIVGIDLGTTNSEIAAFVDGKVSVLGSGERNILPSCVGVSPKGELLVGEAARNQQLLYPERTIRSVKRRMGQEEKIKLGDRAYAPQEIASLIIRELAEWGQAALKRKVEKAVITVPAYFSDAQRQATREAGALAGLEVVRILNEPTAASLAYGTEGQARRTLLVYDLGGGTFDVSIVTIEGDVTEVLASHGNNHLGGDDFDDLLVKRLTAEFRKEYGIDLAQGHPVAVSRLWWAAEEAKKRLSAEPFARVREETLVVEDGKPLHLDVEISRGEYEQSIRSLVESTLESVAQAMSDASKRPSELDAILLVGGATRTPLVSSVLEERAGLVPRQDVHPELCVALGAGMLASRLAGHAVEKVLVDVTPYSFGPSYLGERGGVPYPHCYHPIIRRNTPLPVTRTEQYYTATPNQTAVDVQIYQGDDPDALRNIPVGNFRVEGLTPSGEEQNEVLCRMNLDLDGILHVTATEKRTGKSKHVTIQDALQPLSPSKLAEAEKRLEALYAERQATFSPGGEADDEADRPEVIDISPVESDESEAAEPGWLEALERAREMTGRARRLLDDMHDEDKEEAVNLIEQTEAAIADRDEDALAETLEQLSELLFFVEG